MRITVAILNYNYERFLGAALDSALDQTHRDMEVVVVDDGSTDGSAELIRSYGDRVLPVFKSNGGQGSAMNAAFQVSSGEVVMFLDADDLLEPRAAERAAAEFTRDPSLAWVMFRLALVDAEGAPTGRVRPRRTGVMPGGDLREHLATYRCFHWQPTSGNAFARRALEQVMPVPEAQYRISADAYLAGVVPLCGPVSSTDEVLGSYRVHGSSSFTSATIGADYFRDQIRRQLVTHAHAVELAATLDVDLPRDPLEARDVALLGFRMAVLLLDPEQPGFPGDSRVPLMARGVEAALRNRQLALLTRLRRVAWFLGTGLLPRRFAERLAAAAPDTPATGGRRVVAQGRP